MTSYTLNKSCLSNVSPFSSSKIEQEVLITPLSCSSLDPEQRFCDPGGQLNTTTPQKENSVLAGKSSAINLGNSIFSRFSGLADLTKNSSGVFCRICHEGEQSGERLISPCRCAGTVGLVHKSCVEKWLSTANQDTCEICRHKFTISRHPKPFLQWLCEPAVLDDHRNLVGDLVCFLLLTPLAVVSIYLCGSGAAYYLQEKQSEAVGLVCLTFLLVLTYLVWVLLSIRYHCQVWFKWRHTHQDVRLIEENRTSLRRQFQSSQGQVPNPLIVMEDHQRREQQVPTPTLHQTESPAPVTPLVLTREQSPHYTSHLSEDGEVYTVVNKAEEQRKDLMSDLRQHFLVMGEHSDSLRSTLTGELQNPYINLSVDSPVKLTQAP